VQTLKKFGYPRYLIHEYAEWYLLLRKEQVTFGSLILYSKENKSSLSALSLDSHTELKSIFSDVENILRDNYKYDKINYLMYMMVDPEVHFHIIPRYARKIRFCGEEFVDHGWPGLPNHERVNNVTENTTGKLLHEIKGLFLAK
jgi:diadenosine tetraphosphate (Ap4A) HIT family hydrolase